MEFFINLVDRFKWAYESASAFYGVVALVFSLAGTLSFKGKKLKSFNKKCTKWAAAFALVILLVGPVIYSPEKPKEGNLGISQAVKNASDSTIVQGNGNSTVVNKLTVSGSSNLTIQGNPTFNNITTTFQTDTNAPDLDLYINGQTLERGESVFLPPSRELNLQLRNKGSKEAERVIVDFYCPFQRSEIRSGWYPDGNGTKTMNMWTIISDRRPLASGLNLTLPPIRISTNINLPRFSKEELQNLDIGPIELITSNPTYKAPLFPIGIRVQYGNTKKEYIRLVWHTFN